MTIVMDGTPLRLSSGGLRRYTEELARALREQFPEDRVRTVAEHDRPRNAFDRRWWAIGLSRELSRLNADVFHGTNFEVPYLPLRPTVMTIHDLSPWRDPAWHRNAGRVRKRTPMLVRFGLVTMIITPTETIRREVIERFGVPAARVTAVPEAASQHLAPSAPALDEAYFVFVGALEPRKNIGTILKAWRHVRQQHRVNLVIAGRRREDFPPITEEPGLLVPGEVPENRLSSLYSGAVASLYPSFYEGFGLPVLEAMQCGAPVIASTDPAVMEVSGGAAIHVHATDTRGWIAAMHLLLTDSEECSRRRKLSVARAQEFSWARTARLTRGVYVQAIRQFHGQA